MSSPLTAAPARGQGQGHVESETQPEEGRSRGGLWNSVVVILGDVPGEEVALFRVEAVWKSRAWRGQNWQGSCYCWFQLPVVDIIQEHSRPGAPSDWPVLEGLEVLAALQAEMSSQHEKDHRTCTPIRWQNRHRKKAHLVGRSAIMQGIPVFWAKAIVNHPQVSIIISSQDKDLLIFSFWNNPYVWKTVIIKEYHLDVATNSGITKGELPANGLHSSNLNFLNWLSDHNCPGSSRIAGIIDKDLLIDPLQHYPGRRF
ncbi:hypothetical protein FD755_024493 [Muntiacus reevesi]|uniref:Uncharacterized protein n=1 Tax=Muntiacus reevesi TaxID=9886 RepID=A0A5N3UW61_MUNRE|nr:hypothetical protein FD755_024493 [Muntiacus reevesi]